MPEGNIDYKIDKYQFFRTDETPRLTWPWAEVLKECHGLKAGAEAGLRIALLNVDYVTSFELPFRLLLLRTPQLIAGLRDELQLSQKNVIFNGKRFGYVWSLKADLSTVPDAFQYRLVTRIRRVDPEGVSSASFQQIAKEVKLPRERLRVALESGLQVTALDALFWFGCQRIAAEVLRLRRAVCNGQPNQRCNVERPIFIVSAAWVTGYLCCRTKLTHSCLNSWVNVFLRILTSLALLIISLTKCPE